MSPSGASSRSTITGAWSLGPVPLRARASPPAPPPPARRRAAGQHRVAPPPKVLVEPPAPVAPVGDPPPVRPAVPDHVVQAERQEARQRLPFRRRDVGLAD